MRQDCKHFESRTYRNGETVRKCNLDLAPEAPWRCRELPRLRAADWPTSTGRTARWSPRTPDEPLGALDRADGSVARLLLDEAEEIVNAAGPEIMAEVQAEQFREVEPRWRRWFRRKS